MTAKQRAVVDEATGNINVHGRSGLEIVWQVRTKEGDLLDLSDRDLVFEVGGWLRAVTTPGNDDFSRKLTLTREQIGGLPLEAALNYALHDESASPSCTLWSARLIAYGFNSVPAGGPAVTPGTGSWSGATVTVQQGAAVPTVVVTHIGATGYFAPATMAALNAVDVSLASRIAAEEGARAAADTSLTSRVSTEETTRAAADTSLTSRIGAEETARSTAVTSLAAAVAATYLPLAGGVMAGVLAVVAGTAALPGLAVAGDLNTGIYGVSADVLGVSAGGLNAASFSNGQLSLATAAGGAGVNLAVDAANALALRNGAAAQAFRVYNTTDGTNLERGAVQWALNELNIATEAAGTGSVRAISFSTGGTRRWFLTTGGNLYAAADGAYQIGADGANRPLAVYASSLISSGATLETVGAGAVSFKARTKLTSPSDGVLVLSNNAVSDFSRLNFGGSTSAFPAWKRVGGLFHARLADDSGYTGVRVASLFLENAERLTSGGAAGDSFQFINASGFGVVLAAEAANTLGLRNGNNTQTLNLYRLTDGTNLERLSIYYSSGFNILTEAAGTGVVRDMRIGAGAGGGLYLRGGGTDRWVLYSTGVLNPAADASYDLGSAALRVRNGYFSGLVQLSSYLRWLNGAQIYSQTTSNLTLYNSAADGFGLLQFGGTSNLFPALKRSGTALQARLADDTDFTLMRAKLQTHANAVAETPTATHTLTLYDAAGTAYKVLAVAA